MKKLILLFLSCLIGAQLFANGNSGPLLKTFSNGQGVVGAVRFSPDRRYLVAGSEDGRIRIWSTEDWRPVRTLNEHAGSVQALAFAAQQNWMAAGSSDMSVTLWDTSNWSLLRTLKMGQTVESVGFSVDGQALAIGLGNGRIEIWGTAKWKKIKTLKGHNGLVYATQFSADNQWLLSSSRNGIKIWDVYTWKDQRLISAKQDSVYAAAFSPNSELVAFGGIRGAVDIWNLQKRRKIISLSGHAGAIYSLAFSPDGKYLATGGSDNTIMLWDYIYGARLGVFTAHQGRVYSLAFSEDEKFLASGSADQSVMVWEALRAYISVQDAPLKNSRGDQLMTLPLATPIVVERCQERKLYIRVKPTLKGWVEMEQVSFEKPDLLAPEIKILSRLRQDDFLLLKAAAFDDTEVAHVRLDQQEIERANMVLEKETFNDVFPIETKIPLNLDHAPLLIATDRAGNKFELAIDLSTATLENAPTQSDPEEPFAPSAQ